jgi:hypothetical protein
LQANVGRGKATGDAPADWVLNQPNSQFVASFRTESNTENGDKLAPRRLLPDAKQHTDVGANLHMGEHYNDGDACLRHITGVVKT